MKLVGVVLVLNALCWAKANEMENMKGNISSIEKRLSGMEESIDELSGGILEIKNILGEFIGKNSETGKESNLEERVRFLESKLPHPLRDDVGWVTPNNTDLEERVDALEFQMVNVQENVGEVETQVTNLLEGQLVQDQRLLDVESEADALESTTVDLLAADYELQNSLDELSNELDNRIRNLELNGTVAFHAVLESYESIPVDSIVVFNQAYVNLRNGYNIATGEFTTPPEGAGLYFFFFHMEVDQGQFTLMRIRHNGFFLCDAVDSGQNDGDWSGASCGAIVVLAEGDIVDVYNEFSDDDTPVSTSIDTRNTFTGFRIAPQ